MTDLVFIPGRNVVDPEPAYNDDPRVARDARWTAHLARPGWQHEAACAGLTELMYPERGGPTVEAKAMCHSCPVRIECLHQAMADGEKFGIWGGLSERQRWNLRSGKEPRPFFNRDAPFAPLVEAVDEVLARPTVAHLETARAAKAALAAGTIEVMA